MAARFLLASVLASAAAAASAQSVCPPGRPAVQVMLRGFRAPAGTVRVYLYPDDAGAFTEPNRWLQRAVVPVRSTDPIPVCLAAPAPGRYAVSVGHDTNDNRRRDADDGLGYSRNPRLSPLHLKPRLSEVLIEVGPDVREETIVMNYRFGLSVRPLRR